jgi:adenylyl-sulfate kinase
MVSRGIHAYELDGDNLRFGLNRDLGFSNEDRAENIRRAAEVARLFADSATVVISSFISPFRDDRARAREIAREGHVPFFEIFVDAPLALCEGRDPKGLYKKARSGEIAQFTGVSSPYETPQDAELRLDTSTKDPATCVTEILDLVLPAIRPKKK